MESCEKSVVCALLAQLNKDGLLSKSACSKAEDLVHSWIDFPRFFPYNHDGVNTHLEPDILEHEVKWALGSC